VASRAERSVPPPPRLGGVVREAASDLYYNSWRFLGANMIFGVLFLALLAAVTLTPWGWALSVALVLPAAGCMRMATVLVRDGHTDFGEFLSVVRAPRLSLGLGVAQLIGVVVLVADLWIGARWANVPGTFLAVSALYGLLIGWAYAVVAWPLVLDPAREREPLGARLRLAGALLVAHPVRVALVGGLIGAILAAATVAIAALVTIGLAFAFLVAARYVLPAADRLEGRATVEVDD
jgi:hypothetical protein